MKKNRSVYNVDDFKTKSGEWVSTYTLTTETEYVQYWTRAFKLWVKINGRCSPKGYITKERPSYNSCLNLFKDFQEFAEWCQGQVGYMEKDTNGRFWSIDKDILGEDGNYSPEACCFIPNYVNQMFTSKCNDFNTDKKRKSLKKILSDKTIGDYIKEKILLRFNKLCLERD